MTWKDEIKKEKKETPEAYTKRLKAKLEKEGFKAMTEEEMMFLLYSAHEYE